MNRFSLWGAVSTAALLAAIPTASQARVEMLYVADPAMNMIYGQPLDSDTTNSLVPITGSVTIVADSVAHLSSREIAFVPNAEARVVLLDLETRTMTPVASLPEPGWVCVGAGAGSNDFIWIESLQTSGTLRFGHATRAGLGAPWQVAYHPIAAALGEGFAAANLFMVGEDRFAMVSVAGDLWFHNAATGATTLLATAPGGNIVRGPRNEILLHTPGRATVPIVFDADGNRLEQAAVANAPLFSRGPHVVHWQATAPELTGVTRWLGELVSEDTLDTSPTLVTEHTTRDENGSVIPERDITGAATLFRSSPTRWDFFNETGGLQTLDTTTHRVEYRLQYSAGSGPEFSSIDAIAMGPDARLYVLDAGQRLFRVTISSGQRELLMTFEKPTLSPVIGVRPDGTVVLARRGLDPTGVPKMKLVMVRAAGDQWVAEEGAEGDAPFSGTIADMIAIPAGVRTLWRNEVGARITDLTTTGTTTLAAPRQVAESGTPVVGGGVARFRFEVPEGAHPLAGTIRLAWNYNGTTTVPQGFTLVTPAGQAVAVGPVDVDKLPPMMWPDSGFAMSIRLAGQNLAAGTWTLEYRESEGADSAATLAARMGSSIAMTFDPLDRGLLLAGDGDGGLVVLTRFPATLLNTNETLTVGSAASLADGMRLSRTSDMELDERGRVYLSQQDRFALWRASYAGGSAAPLADKRPGGLDPVLLGRNGPSHVKLAIGPAPEHFAASGWVIR